MQEPTQTERAILRVARTLAAAVDVEDITREITTTALELTGATGVYIERIISADGTVVVIANTGQGTPPHGTIVPYPGSLTEEIIESGEPMMLDSLSTMGKGMAPYIQESCHDCRGIIVPLQAEGHVAGSLVLLRARTASAFNERDASTARVLGDLASVALKRIANDAAIQEERDRHIAREIAARSAAQLEERRARFLASASSMLASSLDLPTTLQNLANLAIDAIADWCVIDVLRDDGCIDRVAAAHSDPSKRELLAQVVQMYAPDANSGDHPSVRTLLDGETVTLNNLTTEQLRSMSRSDEHARIGARLGTHSIMSVPLKMGGDVLGALTLVRGPAAGVFHAADAAFAEDLASRATLAISNARHYSAAEDARGAAEQDRLELVRVVEGKSRLIRGFSHDIKNPLGAADGYAQLLLDGLMGELTEKQTQSIGRIRMGIATALSLINDVVEFSRAESGQIEVRPSPFNTDALVREVVLEHRGAAEQAGVRVTTGLLTGGAMTSDAIRIRQILGNLVINAIKYGGTDGDIVVSVTRDVDDHPRVMFSVADSGQGIPVEKQHLLFEEFTRLHTGKKEGSGLGLAISRRIARVLGGDILVDSAAGRGSTFTLWVPAPAPD